MNVSAEFLEDLGERNLAAAIIAPDTTSIHGSATYQASLIGISGKSSVRRRAGAWAWASGSGAAPQEGNVEIELRAMSQRQKIIRGKSSGLELAKQFGKVSQFGNT